VRWSVDDEVVADGPGRTMTWTVPPSGTHLIDAYAYYPKNPGAFGRRCLQVGVPGAVSAAPTAGGLRDPSRGNQVIAVKLDFEPAPPWQAGTAVTMKATTEGIEGPATYDFLCDDVSVAKTAKPKAVWRADGKVEHVFAVQVGFQAGVVKRTVTFSLR